MSESAAAALIEEIRIGIAGLGMPVGNLNLGLTVSIGLSEMSLGDSLDLALRKADRALYAAKQAGRNRLSA